MGFGLSVAVDPGLRGASGGALAVLMLAIAVSDARDFIVPNALTAPAFALGVLQAVVFEPGATWETLTACGLRVAATTLPLLALMLVYQRLRGRPGMGLGDVKLAAVAGAWLDWFTIVGVIEAAALAALAVYGVRRFHLGRPVTASTMIPFGVFLAPAIWVGWLMQAVLLRP